MKITSIVGINIVVLLALASVGAYGAQMGMSATTNSGKTVVVDAKGNLRVPANYRTTYQFLGSWAVADGEGQDPNQIHVVYASPGTIEKYRKNGSFPDGSVLVKEVFKTTTEPMKTGTVTRALKLKGWFVMVKDSRDSHPGNPLWGNGWGWSWFDADKPLKTTSTNFKADCLSCHVPASATEWIYVQGYPPLRHAH